MGLPAILELITGLLKFPKELMALIRVLSKTPVEKQAELMAQINAEDEKLKSTGRPTW